MSIRFFISLPYVVSIPFYFIYRNVTVTTVTIVDCDDVILSISRAYDYVLSGNQHIVLYHHMSLSIHMSMYMYGYCIICRVFRGRCLCIDKIVVYYPEVIKAYNIIKFNLERLTFF